MSSVVGMQIDWLPADRIEEAQTFIDAHWRRDHRLAHDAGLLSWQHRFFGDSERLAVLVARAGGDIVGALGVIFVPFCIYGRRSLGSWLTTWIATPAAREHQAGLRLLRHALDEQLGFVGTTGANQTALRIYRALGFSIRMSIPRWVRVTSDEALATMLGHCESPYREPTAMPPSTDSLRVLPWSETDAARWDALWERRLAPRLVGTWRDAAYLRWRYLEHPSFTYQVRVAEAADSSLRGAAVHRIAQVDGAPGKVVRIVELHGDTEAMTALAADVVSAAARAGASFAEFYCSAGAVSGPLRACGFSEEPEPSHALPPLIEPLNLELSPLLSGAFHVPDGLGLDPDAFASEDLYVTRSDCDQDRPQ
jgi:hypothetical protein